MPRPRARDRPSARSPSRSPPASPTASACGSAGAATPARPGAPSRRPLRADRACARTSASCARATTCHRARRAGAAGRARLELRGADARRAGDRRGRARHPARRGARRCAARACRGCSATASGDLRVVVNVQIPRRLSEEQRELLEQLRGDDHAREPAQRRVDVRAGCGARCAPARTSGDPPRGARQPRATPTPRSPSCCASRPAGVEEVDDGGDDRSSTSSTAPPASCRACRRCAPRVGGALVEVATSEIEDDWSDALALLPPPGRDRRRAARPRPLARAGPARRAARPRDRARPRRSARAPTRRRAPASSCSSSWPQAGVAHGPLLDLGTGSGVLAIAAATLGFAPVTAVDHEPESVAAAARERRRQRRRRSTCARSTCCATRCPTRRPIAANLLRPLLLELAGAHARAAAPADRLGPAARAGRRGRGRVRGQHGDARARPPRRSATGRRCCSSAPREAAGERAAVALCCLR